MIYASVLLACLIAYLWHRNAQEAQQLIARVLFLLASVIVLSSPAACTAYQSYLDSTSPDPLALRCASNRNDPACIILAMREQKK